MEVVVGEIGYDGDVFFVFVDELFCVGEFVVDHSCGPDGVDGHE